MIKKDPPIADDKPDGRTGQVPAISEGISEFSVPHERTEAVPEERVLTYLEQQFVREYVKDFNLTLAGRRSGHRRDNVLKLLAKPHVRQAIDRIVNERAAVAERDNEKLLTNLYDMATANVAEFIEHYNGACRYCWGHSTKKGKLHIITHDYHYKSKRERDEAHDKFMQRLDSKERKFPNGGLGYDAYRSPNPDCPECLGDGVSQVIIKDTNTGTKGTQLIAGISITPAGKVDLKMHDKLRASQLYMQAVGMLEKDANDHEVRIIVENSIQDLLLNPQPNPNSVTSLDDKDMEFKIEDATKP